VMAESNYVQRETDVAEWARAQEVVKAVGGVFVVAIGNDADASAVAPLAVPGTLAVAAGDEDGAPCGFVAGVGQPGALRGPGCARSTSWPAGSSAATAAVGALVAAIGTQDPGMTSEGIRSRILEDGTRSLGAVRVLAAGGISSGFPVAPLPPIAPVGTAVNSDVPSAVTEQGSTRLLLWRPALVARWVRGSVRVKTRGRHPGVLVVQVIRRGVVVKTVRGTSSAIAISEAARPSAVVGWLESKKQGEWRTLTVRARVNR
jgi:hypothetical protein